MNELTQFLDMLKSVEKEETRNNLVNAFDSMIIYKIDNLIFGLVIDQYDRIVEFPDKNIQVKKSGILSNDKVIQMNKIVYQKM